MPRNRNIRRREKDTFNADVLKDKEDHAVVGSLIGANNTDLDYLLSMFSDVEAEITHAVYIECNRDSK